MTLPTNANWDTAAARDTQVPVYILRIVGVAEEFATHQPIDGGSTVYRAIMNTPTGGGGSIDILDGRRTVQGVKVELLDEDGVITSLIGTEADGAEVTTIINRLATIMAGYIGLDISDYVAIFTGKIRGVRANRSATGYIFNLADLTKSLDQEIFSGADSDTPSYITGNAVNVYGSILRGVFLTTGDFPLIAISTATQTGSHDGSSNVPTLEDSGETWVPGELVGLTVQNLTDESEGIITANTATTVTAILAGGTDDDWDASDNWSIGMSVPTGLDLPAANVDVQRIKDQRDIWHIDDDVRVLVDAPENGRDYLTEEFFRVFQAWPTITGGGKLGISFHTPSLPVAEVPQINETDIVNVRGWIRDLSAHLNSFTINGDFELATGDYLAALYSTVKAEDTADQSNTGETVKYVADSKWLRSELAGIETAEELAARHRIRYLKTPAKLTVDINFNERTVEEGDEIAVTLREVPNLLDGTRGLVDRIMTVLTARPQWEDGLLQLELLDQGFRRYGAIAPDSFPGSKTFTNSTELERSQFFAFCNESDEMADGSPGYTFA